jgi:hypothetical protein
MRLHAYCILPRQLTTPSGKFFIGKFNRLEIIHTSPLSVVLTDFVELVIAARIVTEIKLGNFLEKGLSPLSIMSSLWKSSKHLTEEIFIPGERRLFDQTLKWEKKKRTSSPSSLAN